MIQGAMLPEGWFSENDIKIYRKLISRLPDHSTILEIGVFKGRSICCIADLIINKELRVTAVDTFGGSPGELDTTHACFKEEDVEAICRNNIKQHGLSEYVNIVKISSDEFFEKKLRYDIIFIDGDHSTEQVKKDFENAKKHLAYQGYIIGHDWTWESVRKAVESEVSSINDLWIYKPHGVTAYMSTKSRYFTSLPVTISGIIAQYKHVDFLVIYDDGEKINLWESPFYRQLFTILNEEAIGWEVKFTPHIGKGACYAHMDIMSHAKTDYIWRLDDDLILPSNCLDVLYNVLIGNNLEAVSCPILMYTLDLHEEICSFDIASVMYLPNSQWTILDKAFYKVNHLHCSFLYKKPKQIDLTYYKKISNAQQWEETIFSHQLSKHGSLGITTTTKIFHLNNPEGGRRTSSRENFDKDTEVFMGYLQSEGIELKRYKYIVLNNGIGDHAAFAQILPELNDERLVIFCCFPKLLDVEENENIIIGSINQAQFVLGDIKPYDVYEWMHKNDWKGTLTDAFRELYCNKSIQQEA